MDEQRIASAPPMPGRPHGTLTIVCGRLPATDAHAARGLDERPARIADVERQVAAHGGWTITSDPDEFTLAFTITVAGLRWVAIAHLTDTIYVANLCDSTVSVIDGATCDSSDQSGCGQTPCTVISVIDSDVATIDGRKCIATAGMECRARPIPLRMGGFGGAIALDPSSNTACVPENDGGTLSMFALDA